ncbi:PiggyBac transposable element-derived protein 4 [Araneus ventricosus]|uniref:PiggyBac transposable element-derived protein 4 n=2 Tax=Araneus ventricosus TaxID=182803 RepID=A0A4Y2BTE9_ARAVE|nr:PiggyBac transposable element-derived protein 4 [Araneus ventricosus]
MSKRKRTILSQTEIDAILFGSTSSEDEISSEDDDWPKLDSGNDSSVITDKAEIDTEAEEDADDIDQSHQSIAIEEDGKGADKDRKISWTTAIDNSKIEVKSPNFCSGPVHNLPTGSDPSEYFKLFFTNSMCETVRVNTNKYAEYIQEKKNITHSKWKPVEFVEEIWNFLSVMLIMSIARLPKMSDYWASNPMLGNDMIKRTMTRDRFMEILRYFHLSNREEEKNPQDEGYNIMQKLDPFMKDLKLNFLKHFSPYRELSIDEALIKYKGRLGIVQYMPMKPAKRGIKVWMLCDSRLGYVYNFEPYCGKKDNVPCSEKGLGYDVIRFLCSCLKSTGHHIFFDRFFSSVLLMRDLLNAGQYSTGTIMLNRKYLPENIKEFKLKTAGESKCFQCIETPNLTCTIWKDKKEIALVSTANTYTIESTKRRIGGNVTSIPCPQTIRQYNKFMGGVDLADQKRQYYDVARKSYKWWFYMYRFLINTAANNAHIIYTLTNMPNLKRPMNLYTFKMGLIASLIKNLRPSIATSTRIISHKHERVKIQGRKRVCRHCSSLKIKTLGNHAVESTWICQACKVCLCINCFEPYHNQRNLFQQLNAQ